MLSSKNKQDLVLKDVSINVGDHLILENINLTLEEGLIYTLIGPSGVGKTTLLKLLAGLIPLANGEMEKNEKSYQPQDHLIAYVPQNYGLLPWQSVWQAISEALKISLKTKKLSVQQKVMIEEVLFELNLQGLENSYPSQLSGGQKQRVAIARAFVVAADLVLMDEPFSALDALTREKTQQLFLNIWSKQPQTTLFITHDIQEALLLGDKVILLANQPGEIITVFDNPLARLPKNIEQRLLAPDYQLLVQELREELISYA